MKHTLPILIALMALTLFINCTAYYIKHNPKQALSQALSFSTKSFVNQNYSEAYKLLRKDISPDFTVEKFKELVVGMHPSSEFPKGIIPIEYEVIPGQKQINVYLYGESPNEKHYYCIVMIGTEDLGYSVSELYRRGEPFPNPESRIKIEKIG
jgi:hypothetical protein